MFFLIYTFQNDLVPQINPFLVKPGLRSRGMKGHLRVHLWLDLLLHFPTFPASGHGTGLCPLTLCLCRVGLKSHLQIGVTRRTPLCSHTGALR